MASPSVSSASSRRTGSTKATSVSSRSKRSSAYDSNFEQHLIDHNIYPLLYDFPDDRRPPKPANWEEIRTALKVPRGSLSPSGIPQSTFDDFQRKNRTKSEGTVMRTVVPFIAGSAEIPNEGQLPFTNLDSITGDTTVNPVPDFFDGARPGALEKRVRDDLGKIIVPTKKSGVPVAPNFFLEAKGPGGTLEVAEGQAVLDGAHGALIMHTLQNYLSQEPVYDGNAYAFSSTLLGGYLNLNAHHLTAPTHPGQRPDYHTTQLKAYALRDDEVLLEGIGAFRNLRKLAKKYRDQFVKAANAKARKRHSEATAEKDGHTTTEKQDGGSSPTDFFDCFDYVFAEPEDTGDANSQFTNVGLAIIDQECSQNDTKEQCTEVPTDFTASFASSFTSNLSGMPSTRPESDPKLPHSPPSPSSPRRYKKHAP